MQVRNNVYCMHETLQSLQQVKLGHWTEMLERPEYVGLLGIQSLPHVSWDSAVAVGTA